MLDDKTICPNNNIYLFNVECSTDNYSQNYNIGYKLRKNLKRHIYFCYCKIALRPFTFHNGATLQRVNYSAAIKLEITHIDKEP